MALRVSTTTGRPEMETSGRPSSLMSSKGETCMGGAEKVVQSLRLWDVYLIPERSSDVTSQMPVSLT